MAFPLLGLLGISKFKAIAIGLLALALVLIISAATLHYRGLLADNKRLELERAMLTSALDEQRAATDEALSAVDEWNKAVEDFSAAVDELARVSAEATAERRRLDAFLAHNDLERLAVDDPVAAERLADDYTSRSLRMLECASSGSCPAESGAAGASTGAASP